ncbi:MAG: helix-turn-helix domain-containing protein [Burkholderiales bacterium]
MIEAPVGEETGSQPAAAASPGQLLAAARTRRGLSLDQIADSLRYSPRQLAALESDDYAALPSAPVARGMVRAYAKHVGIDAEPLIENLRRRHTSAPPRVKVQVMAVPFQASPLSEHRRYVWGSIILVGLAALLLINWNASLPSFFQGSTDRPASTPKQDTRDVSGAPIVNPASESVVVDAERNPGPVPAGAEKPPLEAKAPPAVRADAKPAAQGSKRIELKFEGESWVQIRSGTGEMLMNQINAPGNEQAVAGQPPFQIVIGAATGVRMRYNNAPFDLAPHIRDDVARLTLE